MFFGSKCVKGVKMCILHIYKRVGVDALMLSVFIYLFYNIFYYY